MSQLLTIVILGIIGLLVIKFIFKSVIGIAKLIILIAIIAALVWFFGFNEVGKELLS